MTNEEYNRHMDRVDAIKSRAPKKRKYPGMKPLYVRLPEGQVDWIKEEAALQNRSITAILNIMIDAAQGGYIFEKERD